MLKAKRVAVWTDNSMDFTRALSKFFIQRFKGRGGEISYTRPSIVPPKPVAIVSVNGGKYAVEEI